MSTTRRSEVKTFGALALVDFYSERFNGQPRFIIVRDRVDVLYSQEYLEDLRQIMEYAYVYDVDKDHYITEYAVKDFWLNLFED